jgi:hypothetical protein
MIVVGKSVKNMGRKSSRGSLEKLVQVIVAEGKETRSRGVRLGFLIWNCHLHGNKKCCVLHYIIHNGLNNCYYFGYLRIDHHPIKPNRPPALPLTILSLYYQEIHQTLGCQPKIGTP